MLTVTILGACGGGSSGAISTPFPDTAICLALPNEIVVNREPESSEWTDVVVDSRGRLWVAGWTIGQSQLLLGQTDVAIHALGRAVQLHARYRLPTIAGDPRISLAMLYLQRDQLGWHGTLLCPFWTKRCKVT